MLEGAIIGALVGLATLFIINSIRNGKFKSLQSALANKNVDYIIPAYYASSERFRKSMKIYDSFGAFYIMGDKAYYMTDNQTDEFDLKTMDVTNEGKWRNLNWFSLTSPVGAKYYFTSYKMGAFKNDSTAAVETCNRLTSIKSRS